MTRRPGYRFDYRWREGATLADGTPVMIRLVRPEDKRFLAAGFAALSPTSRYLRFFTAKQALTERELDRLTDLDGVDQLALGAVRSLPDGSEEGLGIARFARDPSVPTVAEAAVTVTDAFQGKGLGTLLLSRLADAARERGIDCFSGEFLASNAAVRQLIEEACPDARLFAEGDVIRAEVPLARMVGAVPQAPGARLLRHVAGGRLELRLRHLLLKDPEHSL
ncbi:MAG: GNAT family N-acetyltransferase [Gemmatimonadota bacterium]|nr:GNAT family N-acetyltransferase [Gemmatimonadota bacterium]MDH4349995.1 GNAT family N-acetyltransferase [Gemmatimonadota bacterium]MDH5196158.1 GNAT family N-acetyltransferase [Gemmatimonadota bacterium]